MSSSPNSAACAPYTGFQFFNDSLLQLAHCELDCFDYLLGRSSLDGRKLLLLAEFSACIAPIII
ncbi:MAG: hypothetical protein AAGU75_11775, partial [Bacillota bacterium]